MNPPRFACLDLYRQPFAEGAPELDWLEQALAGGSVAALWQATPALVAPASYRALLAAPRPAPAVDAWPVRLRRSGGGVVPQGPGILNLSLAYAPGGPMGEHGEAVYQHLCSVLAAAARALGVDAFTSAVPGSFCDGRFNLACGAVNRPRKLAGTAQYWRTRQGRHAVLAHAVVLLDADPQRITAAVNALEQDLASGRCHSAAALTTLAAETCSDGSTVDVREPGRVARFARALADALATRLRAADQDAGSCVGDTMP